MNNTLSKQVVPNNVSAKLQKKYGDKRIRKALVYYGWNLPEYTWFENYVEAKVDLSDMMKEINDDKSFSIFYNANKIREMMLVLSTIFKSINKPDMYRVDYYQLLSNLIGQFGDFKMNQTLEIFDDLDVVAITGVKFGDMLNKNMELFLAFVENLMNSTTNKTFIFALERTENVKDMGEAYSEFYNFIKNYTKIIEII